MNDGARAPNQFFARRFGAGPARVVCSRGEDPISIWRKRVSKALVGILEASLGVAISNNKGAIRYRFARVAEVISPRKRELTAVWEPKDVLGRKFAGTAGYPGSTFAEEAEAELAAEVRSWA